MLLSLLLNPLEQLFLHSLILDLSSCSLFSLYSSINPSLDILLCNLKNLRSLLKSIEISQSNTSHLFHRTKDLIFSSLRTIKWAMNLDNFLFSSTGDNLFLRTNYVGRKMVHETTLDNSFLDCFFWLQNDTIFKKLFFQLFELIQRSLPINTILL